MKLSKKYIQIAGNIFKSKKTILSGKEKKKEIVEIIDLTEVNEIESYLIVKALISLTLSKEDRINIAESMRIKASQVKDIDIYRYGMYKDQDVQVTEVYSIKEIENYLENV